jgi:hypothetical protein
MSTEMAGRVDLRDARACYLAEWYRLELGDESLDRAVATIEACASTSGAGESVKLLAMLAVPTDEVVFGVFAARSADDVAEVCRQAGLPAQRLTAAFDARRPVGEQSDC